MAELLRGCMLYRWTLAILSWCARGKRKPGAAGVLPPAGVPVRQPRGSRAAFRPVQARSTRAERKLLTRCNERLSQKGTSWIESSVLYQVYRAVFTCGRNSRTFGWLFSGGMTAILLVAIGLYVLIDYVLRDISVHPGGVLCGDEALLLFCVLWIIWERKKAASPIAPKFNPLDLPVAVFLTVCFVLLCVVCPYTSIQIAGFRATCQYLLWFYLVTRLIRNDRDCMTLYLTLVSLSFCSLCSTAFISILRKRRCRLTGWRRRKPLFGRGSTPFSAVPTSWATSWYSSSR